MATLTDLSFLFTLTYPLFFKYFLSWTGTSPLTTADCQSACGPVSCSNAFFFHCDLIPSFLASPAESWLSCFVLEQLVFIPVCSCKCSLQYTLGLPLQHTLYIVRLPHHMQHIHISGSIQTSTAYIALHTHMRTEILTTFFYYEAALHTLLDHSERVVPPLSQFCDLYCLRYKPPVN